jgi:hypothetical protein
MRKLLVWGAAATLALGLAVHPAAAADEDADKAPPPSFWGRLFGKRDKPADKPEKDSAKPHPKKSSDEEAGKGEQPRELSDQEKLVLAREDYVRREEVLDKLMQLAQEKNDQEMLKKIDSLTHRAWSVYLRKSGQKPPAATARNEQRSESADPRPHRERRSPAPVIEIKGEEQP